MNFIDKSFFIEKIFTLHYFDLIQSKITYQLIKNIVIIEIISNIKVCLLLSIITSILF